LLFELFSTILERDRRPLSSRETAHRSHALYYLVLAEEAEPHLKGAQQLVWLKRLEQEQGNLCAVLSWLMEQEEAELAVRLYAALWRFWDLRGYWSEGRRWLRAALSLSGAQGRTVARAKALNAAGNLAHRQYDEAVAHLLLAESVTLCSELNQDRELVGPLGKLGEVMQRQGDLAAGRSLIEECMVLCRKLGSHWDFARLLYRLAYLAWLEGDLTQKVALLQESRVLAREVGDKDVIANALNSLGYTAYLQGNQILAATQAQEAITLAQELGDIGNIGY